MNDCLLFCSISMTATLNFTKDYLPRANSALLDQNKMSTSKYYWLTMLACRIVMVDGINSLSCVWRKEILRFEWAAGGIILYGTLWKALGILGQCLKWTQRSTSISSFQILIMMPLPKMICDCWWKIGKQSWKVVSVMILYHSHQQSYLSSHKYSSRGTIIM